MTDLKRASIKGHAVTVRGNDIDTDRIIPARYLRCVTFEGLGDHAFEDDRIQLREKGQTHTFDQPKHHRAEILFVNKNFGCGSSREHAPQAIKRWMRGIKAVVGESFAEIFFGNCVALGMPCAVVSHDDIQKLMAANETDHEGEFAVDLHSRTVSYTPSSYAPSEASAFRVPTHVPEGPRQQFIEGRWDSTAELLEAKHAVEATAAALPYFNGWK
jgi:3-isopropylmalate/(R)-2-methylmalate dehydratase small subunit